MLLIIKKLSCSLYPLTHHADWSAHIQSQSSFSNRSAQTIQCNASLWRHFAAACQPSPCHRQQRHEASSHYQQWPSPDDHQWRSLSVILFPNASELFGLSVLSLVPVDNEGKVSEEILNLKTHIDSSYIIKFFMLPKQFDSDRWCTKHTNVGNWKIQTKVSFLIHYLYIP